MSGVAPHRAFQRIYQQGDRLMCWAVLVHIGISLLLAPFYDTWLLTLMVAGLAAGMYFGSYLLLPGSLFTRIVAGISLQTFVALHIYQLHGLAEMHFFFFTSVSALIVYQDWRAMWPGVVLIILQHILFAYLHNAGVKLYFFEQSYVGLLKLVAHFGIAIAHTVLCGWIAIGLRDQTRREQATNQTLAAEKERYRLLAANLPNGCLYILDRNRQVQFVDGLELARLGKRQDEVVGLQYPEQLVAASHQPEAWQAIQRLFAGQSAHWTTQQGDDWYANAGVPLFGANGSIVQLQFIAQNITQRFQAEQLQMQLQAQLQASLNEKEHLLAEVHHRVKNNLSIVSGLLHLQRNQTDNQETAQILLQAQSRIRAMALVHEQLYNTENFGDVQLPAYMRSLVGSLQNVFAKDDLGLEVTYEVADVQLELNTGIPVGLLVSEAVSNALKHAFVGRHSGHLRVHVSNGHHIRLEIQDDGIGIPEAVLTSSQSTGLGMRLIKGLAAQVHGELSITSNASGTTVALTIPKPESAHNRAS